MNYVAAIPEGAVALNTYITISMYVYGSNICATNEAVRNGEKNEKV